MYGCILNTYIVLLKRSANTCTCIRCARTQAELNNKSLKIKKSSRLDTCYLNHSYHASNK